MTLDAIEDDNISGSLDSIRLQCAVDGGQTLEFNQLKAENINKRIENDKLPTNSFYNKLQQMQN